MQGLDSMTANPDLKFEKRLWPHFKYIAGLDEAGRGALAGPVAVGAVILPNEIWLLDFKTDEVQGEELEARVREYRTQLRIYSIALTRVYRRPVTTAWLHFLAMGRTVEV